MSPLGGWCSSREWAQHWRFSLMAILSTRRVNRSPFPAGLGEEHDPWGQPWLLSRDKPQDGNLWCRVMRAGGPGVHGIWCNHEAPSQAAWETGEREVRRFKLTSGNLSFDVLGHSDFSGPWMKSRTSSCGSSHLVFYVFWGGKGPYLGYIGLLA